MRIDGPIPFHAARAYGVARTPAPAGRPTPVGPGAGPGVARPVGGVRPSPDVLPTAPASAPRIDALVGGRVPGGVNFEDRARPAATDRLALYTRAADSVEASVGIALGRSLDVTG